MGKIRCASCNLVRTSAGPCPRCGGVHCYIYIWWRRRGEEKGKDWRISRFTDGFKLDYERALALIGTIRTRIAEHRFDPLDFSEGKIAERQFGNKVDRWLRIKEKERDKDIIRPSSYSNIQGHMNNHILPFFENFDVKEITKEDLANFRDGLEGIKNKTIKNVFVTLHSFFNWLHQDIALTVPPFPPLAPDDDADEREALDIDEQISALKLIPEGIERDMLEFGMETGVRPGELVALKVKDFNLEAGTVKVRRTVSKFTYVLEGTKGRKSKHSRRREEIPLSDRALALVEPYVKGRFGEEWLFICKVTGTRYSVKAPNRIWKKYTKSDLIYYEASRHSFLTQLSDAGVDPADMRDLARQADIRTTMNYVHKRVEHLREKTNVRSNLINFKKAKGNPER